MPDDYRYSHQKQGADPGVRRRRAWWLYGAMAATILGILIAFKGVLLPFLFAMIVVYIIAPLVSGMENRGMPRWLAVILCYAVIIGGLTLSSLYLAPKLKSESIKVAQRFQTLLAAVPSAVDRVGNDMARILDKLEGRQPDADRKQGAETAEWGFGPSVLPVPVFQYGIAPGPERISFGASDQDAVTLARELRKKRKSQEEIEVDKSRSHVVLTRIDDGVYGVRMNDTTMEFRRSGDGTFRIVPRAADSDPLKNETLRNRLVHSLRNSLEHFAGRIVKEVVGLVRDIVSIATRAIVALVVLFMVAAFMLMDYARIASWFRSRVPSNYRSDYDELCERLNSGLSGVIRGQLIICVVNGILSGIGFLIFIPEYALTFAVFAGVMSIIPIFGTIISTVPAVLIGMTVSWGTAMAVLFWVLGVHALEANILNPKIIAKQARLSPVLVIFALIAGEATFGIVGALLAVPTLSVLHSLMSFLFVRIQPEIIERS